MTKQRSRPDLQDESRLVARMLEGDEAAFRVFFNTYYPRLASFVASRSSVDPASIDDVVQATLIKAMRGLSGYRSDSSLCTWLCTICWQKAAGRASHHPLQPGVDLERTELGSAPAPSPP